MSQKESEKPVAPNSEERQPEEPDENIEFPAFDVVTEGYDPSQIKGNTPTSEEKK